ncbi:MAG: hypothetical protein CME26_08370 [Gemmatimonadetes bacterium]|nr:hypothetical protein [Gemmatimonadota bacterium]
MGGSHFYAHEGRCFRGLNRVAELVDLKGILRSDHTLPWNGWNLSERLATSSPVYVDSDVRAAARGEAVFGVGRGWRDWVYVTIGTGIGGCLVRDGEPYAGARGNAMIIGSGALTNICESCGVTSHPVTENLASGPALARRFREIRGEVAMAEDVFAAAQDGDPAGRGLLEEAGVTMGVTLAFLINTLDPEGVVIGGGLGLAEGPYRTGMEASVREHIWAEAARGLEIRNVVLGVDAGIVGAGLVAAECIENR